MAQHRAPDVRTTSGSSSGMDNLLDLTLEILAHALSSLARIELARAACTCRALHAAAAEVYKATRTANVQFLGLSHSLRPRMALFKQPEFRLRVLTGRDRTVDNSWGARRIASLTGSLGPLRSLLELSLKGLRGVDDEVVMGLLAPNLPQLRHLDLSETAVATRGAISLKALSSLTSLDITFCPLVSYAAVIVLREACPRLRHLRRLPKWLEGHFETPWGEVHTYYPCGAFEFERGMQSTGWVAQLRERVTWWDASRFETPYPIDDDDDDDEHGVATHLEDRLIFLDGLPSHDNGRLGVCLCPRGDGRVLVVQDTATLEPPRMAHRALKNGYGLPETGESVRFGSVMLSCMRVRPLDGCTEPPPALAAKLREFCKRRSNAGNREASLFERQAFFSCQTQDVFEKHPTHWRPTNLEQEMDYAARTELTCESGDQDTFTSMLR